MQISTNFYPQNFSANRISQGSASKAFHGQNIDLSHSIISSKFDGKANLPTNLLKAYYTSFKGDEPEEPYAEIQRDKNGLMPDSKTEQIIKNVQEIDYNVDLSRLSKNEKKALVKLIEAADYIHEAFRAQDYPEGNQVQARLKSLAEKNVLNANNSYYLFESIDRRKFTHLNEIYDQDNNRYLIVDGQKRPAGGTLYPSGFSYSNKDIRDQLKISQGFRADDLFNAETVIKESTEENIMKDLEKFKKHPELIPWNYEFKKKLENIKAEAKTYYATPYSIEYADQLVPASKKLREAAMLLTQDDPKLADHLISRANDFLKNNYYESDLKWVDIDGNLDILIGPTENYYDTLNKNKNFFDAMIFVRDHKATEKLNRILKEINVLEQSLPIDDKYKKDKSQIKLPITLIETVYRAGNSKYFYSMAQVFPNNPIVGETKGRRTLLYKDVIESKASRGKIQQKAALILNDHLQKYVKIEGTINFTIGHELSHTLGPDYTANNKNLTITEALGKHDKVFEELKADVLSLYLTTILKQRGFYTDQELKEIWVTNLARELNITDPKNSDDYDKRSLMKFNYLLDHGAISYDSETKKVDVDFDKFAEVIKNFAKEVLEIQLLGNSDHYATLEKFMSKYFVWNEVNKEIAEILKKMNLPTHLHMNFPTVDKLKRDYGRYT